MWLSILQVANMNSWAPKKIIVKKNSEFWFSIIWSWLHENQSLKEFTNGIALLVFLWDSMPSFPLLHEGLKDIVDPRRAKRLWLGRLAISDGETIILHPTPMFGKHLWGHKRKDWVPYQQHLLRRHNSALPSSSLSPGQRYHCSYEAFTESKVLWIRGSKGKQLSRCALQRDFSSPAVHLI